MVAKVTLIFLLFFCLVHRLPAQPCVSSLQGTVWELKGTPLPGAVISLFPLNRQTVTDESGKFWFSDLCEGDFTLICTSVGWKTVRKNLRIYSSKTRLNFDLLPDTLELAEVTVQDFRSEAAGLLQNQTELSGRELSATRGLSLGESLKILPGLNTLQTGPSLAKPVIHGLHSNRILILNNGIRQEGQQWGNEHAPEIDPFVANRISVIRGASSVRYGADAIGGVILLEPAPLPQNTPLSAEMNLSGFSNNRQGTASGILQGGHRGWGWRVQGTLKKAGTARTPDYYLTNSQFEEQNFSLSTGYSVKKWGVEAFFSRFTTRIGIFSGSHIGNTTDLQAALTSDTPLVPSEFSYKTGTPFQKISHNLLKVKAFYDFPKLGKFSLILGSQYNDRLEYDLHKAYNDSIATLDMPALRFSLNTYTLEGLWEHNVGHNLSGMAGIATIYQSNVVGGRAFLIPNFRNQGIGFFWVGRIRKNKWQLEAGLRYDFRLLEVFRLVNRQILTPVYTYHSFSGSAGAEYQLKPQWSVRMNAGTAWRPPNTSELYSNGVHHGAAAYEKGDSSLTPEYAYQLTLSSVFNSRRWELEMGVYANRMNGYIYLKPDSLPVLTIRGAFPAYTYTQVNTFFKGLDAQIKYSLTPFLSWQIKMTVVRAFNLTENEPLIYISPDRLENSVRWNLPLRQKSKKVSEVYVSVSVVNVSKQRRVPPTFTRTETLAGVERTIVTGDFAQPPAGYMLLQAEAGLDFRLGRQKSSLILQSTNLTNQCYRDYLNRFRYYANETGRNISLRLQIKL
jgi:iron complex outermembrane recepter protein